MWLKIVAVIVFPEVSLNYLKYRFDIIIKIFGLLFWLSFFTMVLSFHRKLAFLPMHYAREI